MKKINSQTLVLLGLVILLGATACTGQRPVRLTNIPGSGATVGGGGTTPPVGPDPTIPPVGPGTTIPKTPQGPFESTTTSGLDRFSDAVPNRAFFSAQTVAFDFDSATVKANQQEKVADVAKHLKSKPADLLLIEGHSDERGTEEYNRSLGERRALSLREALGKLGVDGDRIRTLSFGEDKPADAGHTEAAWTKNRRGEFILLEPKKK
ncbi:MAG: hypothetical protein EXS29_04660 [Pedosphaera sp.]|nr:hypothetical protein [Pedosphaera sp.]